MEKSDCQFVRMYRRGVQERSKNMNPELRELLRNWVDNELENSVHIPDFKYDGFMTGFMWLKQELGEEYPFKVRLTARAAYYLWFWVLEHESEDEAQEIHAINWVLWKINKKYSLIELIRSE